MRGGTTKRDVAIDAAELAVDFGVGQARPGHAGQLGIGGDEGGSVLGAEVAGLERHLEGRDVGVGIESGGPPGSSKSSPVAGRSPSPSPNGAPSGA
ncbi:MAG: hypothetical protein KDE35_17095 [Geminicoccaceae bacterium]|nr:hypothetical protein [Geminicoccaceae bacterium]